MIDDLEADTAKSLQTYFEYVKQNKDRYEMIEILNPDRWDRTRTNAIRPFRHGTRRWIQNDGRTDTVHLTFPDFVLQDVTVEYELPDVPWADRQLFEDAWAPIASALVQVFGPEIRRAT